MFFKKSIKCVKMCSIKHFSEKSGTGCHFIPPKLYAEANISKEKEYYDFESMKLNIG